MEIIQYILLAFVQGLTEFIPVSSSGHLIFFQTVLGIKEPMLVFDVMLHVATTLAVIIFLRRELLLIIQEILMVMRNCVKGEGMAQSLRQFDHAKLSVLIIIAFIPAVIFGLFFHSLIEKMFTSLRVVGVSFCITGFILFITKYSRSEKGLKQVNFTDACVIGIAQALAIIPGISRSGATISAGLYRKLDKELAAKFSFLLSLPTILAAAVYKLKDGIGQVNIDGAVLALSFITAFISGYITLVILSKMIARARFHYFSYYCWLMGIISIIISVR